MAANSRAAVGRPPASNFSDASPANTVAENIARISELERAARRELTGSEASAKPSPISPVACGSSSCSSPCLPAGRCGT